jgi:hypothetical protein
LVGAVETYREASENADIDRLMTAFAPDAEVVSPISARMVFRGEDDLRHLLAAVYGTVKDLRWTKAIGEGDQRVLYGEFRVGPLRMSDAMVFDLGPDGRISTMRPHLRPWLGLTLFALALGPKVVRRPGVVRRALRG